MKRKVLAASLAISATLLVSGCSMFYPMPTTTPTIEPTETPTETPTPTPTLNPDLTKIDLNVLDASAFRDNGTVTVIVEALGVMEDDGKCTLNVTQDKASQTVTVSSEPNVTSTQCFPMEVPIAGFKDGKLQFSVLYVSSKSTGLISSGTLSVE